MEVHHHSHAHGHDNHRRKKWKAYFWEFLMLFLAVFFGFLAEYKLEHVIEHKREKQYIQALINDVTADTARINSIIHNRNRRETRLDSLTFLLNNSPEKTNEIYFYGSTVNRVIAIRFVPNDGTLQQLKHAGGLRLIKKRNVVDSIARYDVSIRNLIQQGEGEMALISKYAEAEHKIFDALIFDKMLDKDNFLIRPDHNPPLAPFTPADRREFNSRLHPVKSINKSARRDERIFLKQAENLLALLKKEYHLD